MKLDRAYGDAMDGESPPAWGRGLKPQGGNHWLDGFVAPRVGAWIETAHSDHGP